MDRYINLLMGEIPRLTDDLNGYGPKGKNFIAHVDIPQNVQEAFAQLKLMYEIRNANPAFASIQEIDMKIKTAEMKDLESITKVEAKCFPVTEAATKNDFENRLKYYPNHFWLLFDGNQLISFVDGFVTNEMDLSDEMYEKADMHNENGDWQMIFGVNTLPEYRNQGYAALLIQKAISDAKEQGRKGLVLTCKKSLIHYYSKFGFQNEGISKSVHGNVTWYQMRYRF